MSEAHDIHKIYEKVETIEQVLLLGYEGQLPVMTRLALIERDRRIATYIVDIVRSVGMAIAVALLLR